MAKFNWRSCGGGSIHPVIGPQPFCMGLAALVRAASRGERGAGGRAGPGRAGARARTPRTAAACWRRTA
jgi:hypothetical protein